MTAASEEPGPSAATAAAPAGDPVLPEPPAPPEPALPGATPPAPALPGPLLPDRSSEDTDAAWGDYQDRSDDHLYRDRPPHWADY
jgi:hypothetical protein